LRVFFIAVLSANGKISRSHTASVDWNSEADLKWFKDITTKAGVVVMGRRTFETLKSPLPKRLNVVMTHNPSHEEIPNVMFTDVLPDNLIKTLEKRGYNSVAIVGGQSIFTLFLKEKLVDEMYLTYEPIIFDGIDLFSDLNGDVKMKMINVKILDSGAVVVHYKIMYLENEYGKRV